MIKFDNVREESAGGQKLYTGYTDFQIMKINPSNDDYLEITGSELPYELSYEADDYGKRPLRAIVYCEAIKRYELINLPKVSTDIATTKDGNKYTRMNAYADVSYQMTDEDFERYESQYFKKEGVFKSRIGEQELYHIMKIVMRYDRTKGTPFVKSINSQGINFEDIANGKVDKLNEFFEYFRKNKIQMMYYVRQTDSGKLRQGVITDDKEMIYYPKSTKINKVQDYINAQAAAGYPIFNSSEYYSIEFKEFNESELRKNDEELVSPTGLFDSDIPF